MFYSLFVYVYVFTYIASVFKKNILESSLCQSVLSPSPSAGLVIWRMVRYSPGSRGPLWAPGLPARYPNQTEPLDSLLRLLGDP